MNLKKHLFSIEGRISRNNFAKAFFIVLSLPLVFFAIFSVTDINDAVKGIETTSQTSSLLHDIAKIIIPIWGILTFTAPAVRRLHDINLTGWLVLLFLIPVPYLPLIGAVFLLATKGTAGPNKYGTDPLEGK